MKIAFNQATTLRKSTLAKDLTFCEKVGYDYIEIRLDQLRDYLQEQTVDDLTAFFQQSHLKPYAFNALEFINFRHAIDFEQIKADCRFLCEIGKAIHCNRIIVVPSFDIGDYTKAQIQAETIRVLKELAEVAEPYGMKLALEFCGYPNCSINTFAQAYSIICELDHDHVGLVLDCFHFHAMNSDLNDLRQADPEKIFVFHIDDCEDLPVGSLRDHHRLWPGEGAIDLEGILRTLKEIGYSEMASIELFRPEYWEWDVEKTIRVAKEKTERVIRPIFGE
mgnify:CR=1 FL=1